MYIIQKNRGIAAGMTVLVWVLLMVIFGSCRITVGAQVHAQTSVMGKVHYTVGLSINSNETYDNGTVSFPFIGATANAMVDIYLDTVITLFIDENGQTGYKTAPVSGRNSAYAYTEATSDGRHFNGLQWAAVCVAAKTRGIQGKLPPASEGSQTVNLYADTEMNAVSVVEFGDDEDCWSVDWCEISEKWLIGAALEFDLPVYEVTYDANGGTGQMDCVECGYGNSFHILPNSFERSGYQFDGWNSAADGSGITYIVGEQVRCTRNVQLYAQWRPDIAQVRVEHYVMDTQGKYPVSPDRIEYKKQVVTGQRLKMELLKDASLEIDGGIAYAYGEVNGRRIEVLSVSNPVTVRLYYKRASHTVTYKVGDNGGNWPDGKTEDKWVQVFYGAPLPDFKGMKTDWQFLGWSTDENATQANASATMGLQDITLYALFQKKITITFKDCRSCCETSTILFNKEDSGLIDVPEIAEYQDWADVTNTRVIGYNSHAQVEEDNTVSLRCEIPGGMRQFSATKNQTYYAVYAADVKLDYVLDGGTANETTAQVTGTVYRTAYNLQKTTGIDVQLGESRKMAHTEDGYTYTYTFAVWAENGIDGPKYASNAAYCVVKDTTMYGIWDMQAAANRYTIIYDANGGRDAPPEQKAQFDQRILIAENRPVRIGYDFLAWNTRMDGSGTSYLPGTAVKNLTAVDEAEVRLYAQWHKRTFKLVKASSNRYNANIVQRTDGDDQWFHAFGKLSVSQQMQLSDNECVQVWRISIEGIIKQIQ